MDRDDRALASVLQGCDLAVIQELVAPPFPGTFPDGAAFNPDPQSAEFFQEMAVLGFDFVLSEEDTGTGDTIHLNSSATEWWVTFYNPDAVQIAVDLPTTFLADDRSNHDDYERVPYAFGFRTVDGRLDFVLISVHLKPSAGTANATRRKHELAAIAGWIADHDQHEHDFIILGDMNIESATELASATPAGFMSLNDECRPTNTNVNGPKPYDHVMVNPAHTTEIDAAFDLHVINLIDAMQPFWNSPDPYPGQPYAHNAFRRFYTDHHPVVFKLIPAAQDDD